MASGHVALHRQTVKRRDSEIRTPLPFANASRLATKPPNFPILGEKKRGPGCEGVGAVVRVVWQSVLVGTSRWQCFRGFCYASVLFIISFRFPKPV